MNHVLRAIKRRRCRSHRRELAQRLESLEQRRLLAGDLVVNEIMYHPVSGKARDEWIELYNPGDQSIDLDGYRITEGVDFVFPNVELGAGEYLVVAADEEAFAANYPDVTNWIGGWEGRLSNRSEDIVIEDAQGGVTERALYADSGDWAARRSEIDLGAPGWTWLAAHDGEGQSLELVHWRMPRDLGHNWATSVPEGGTPGSVNSRAVDNIAPAIAEVQHSPAIPTSSDPVTISARIVDEQVGVSASVFYRESTLTPGDFIEVEMQSTGRGETYVATIPEFADQTVIEFYVQATDAVGAHRTSPAPSDDAGGQEANLLYQVDDSDHPNDVPLYRSIMTVPDRRQFERQNRFSDAQMNATFIATVGGQSDVRHNVGVRYRGSGTRDNTPANNRINIPSDRDWQGVTQININAVNPRNQVAGSAIAALAGINAADAFPIRMLGNGEDLGRGGYFTHLEVLNSDWADRHYPLDGQGNVYRGRRANEGPPGGFGAGLQYFGENQAPYVSYLKGSNRSEADYSDVVNLTNVLNNTPDESYLEEVGKVVNIDQWLRTIAFIELTGYDEFSLLTGDSRGDDYAMYRGVEDRRFQMVPYDLDTMFANPRGSIFRSTNVPALNRFLSQPEIRARYYTQLVDLMDHALTPERVRPTLEEILGTVESENRFEAIERFFERRFEFVREQIQMNLTGTSDMQPADDYFRTTSAESGLIEGRANAMTTRSVEVNGLPATWNALSAQWSISGVPLEPGLNRLRIQSFDSDGIQTEEITMGVWRDDGAPTVVTQAIDRDTVWTAANGPYQVNGNVSVASGATLTIEAGTTVFFGSAAQLTIRGRLVAVGSEQQPIWLTRQPGSGVVWNGLQFNRSEEDNQIKHAVLEYAETVDGMIGLDRSQIELDHVTLDHSGLRRIRTQNSSLVVRNSIFKPIALPGQPPATDNLSEHIWGQGIPADGQWLLENNVFGHITGHNDGIDFDAPRLPNAIPVIRNNVFEGGGDDAMDLTGDVYVEGNVFRNYLKDPFNTDPGESNTISASMGTFWVVRNVFENVQHVSLVKENAFMHFLNNTVVGAERSALYFDLPGQTTGPGRGARVEGSVFADTPLVFDQVRGNTELTVDSSWVNAADVSLGTNNLSGDPHLAGSKDNFAALPGSPTLGSGPDGTDMGASIDAGAIILGEPDVLTAETDATLTVAGPGLSEYRYRVNDNAWSDPQPIESPIQLTGLIDGTYTVQVIGLNAVDLWQDEVEATTSRSWTVDTQRSHVRINEVLADNDGVVIHEGTEPDLVELFNDGATVIDLSGMSLTDDLDEPRKFVFPDRTVMAGQQYLTVYADEQFVLSGIHLGFGLSAEGEGLYLFDRADQGGQLLDSVEFGVQVPNLSLGRDESAQWTLTEPTFGAANESVALGDPTHLRINEWLADNEVSRTNDFVELYNPDPGPVDAGGLFLTDHPLGWPDRHAIAPLSFVAASGYTTFVADGDPEDGPDHLDFRISRLQGMIGLFDESSQLIDVVRYGPQQPDVSVGFDPDGSSSISSFRLPTPGQSNASPNLPQAEQLLDNLRLTELMYNPIGGSDFEFIEVQNIGAQTLNLRGVRIDGGVDFVFPDQQLAPKEYLVVVNDVASFRQRHGDAVVVAGEFDGNLGNGGEEIRLRLPDPLDVNILSFEYDDRWHGSTDGAGFSLVIDNPSGARRNWGSADAWRPSNFVNGSPGFVDAGLDEGIIVINEVLANTDQAGGGKIELHNTTEANLDLSHWYLSNDSSTLTKFQLPEGTIVPPLGYVLFSEVTDFGGAFTLADHGGDVYLSSSDAIGGVAGFIATAKYGAVDADTSFGRVAISDGSFDFAAQSQVTLGAENSAPLLGPIFISEVMYDPPDDDEYVELHNPGAVAVSFGDGQTWSLDGAVDFEFPAGVQLDAGAYLLVVENDPGDFRTRHAIPAEVTILGPYAGTLDDEGDDLLLVRPSADPDSPIVADRVNFDNEAPWPLEASGGVSALNREPLVSYGNDPAHWLPSIAFGTPGRANVGIDRSAASVPTQLVWDVDVGPAISLNWADSSDPETGVTTYRVYRNDVEIGTSRTSDFRDMDVQAPGSYQYQVSAINGQGIESALSQPLDASLMAVDSVLSRFSDQVIVTFTETVVRSSAEDAANYSIPGIDVLSATLADNIQTVTLRTSEIEAEVPLVLSISNLVGVSGNPLPPGLETPFSFREGVPGFTVRGVQTRTARARQLDQVPGVLALAPTSRSVIAHATAIYPTINFLDDDGHAPFSQFSDDRRFPTDAAGDDNNLVIHATGYLTVTEDQAGTWTFGANIDAPGETTANISLVPFGSMWRYLDDGSDQATPWREPGFDDADWQQGPAQLGYGDGDESTTVQFGPDANNKHVTTYFRHRFQVPDPSAIQAISGALVRDDGGAVYLNGVEIARQGLVADAAAGDLADQDLPDVFENAPVRFSFDPALLVPGENVLAVEVHQGSTSSDDLSFDLNIEAVLRQTASTDGFRLLVDGQEIVVADTDNADADRLGTVSLSRGAHTLDFIFFERDEGAEVELFAAPGQHGSLAATDSWRLVGDEANGGLRVRTDPSPPLPMNWQRKIPDGSLIFGFQTDASLNGGDVPVSYISEFQLGEPLSLVAAPGSTDATLTIKLRDELTTFASEIAAAPGQPVAVTDFVPDKDGLYWVEVSSDVVADVSIEAIVNSSLEGETVGGPSNDEMASAQIISNSERRIGGVRRLAVRGRGDGLDTSDFYSVDLAMGDIVMLANSLGESAPSQLRLRATNGDLLALGIDKGNVNSITDFEIKADGTYFVEVAAETDLDYTLVLTRNAGLDALPNDRLADAAPFSQSLTMLGALGGAAGSAGTTGGTTALPAVLIDGDGFTWDIQGGASIDNGTGDAYDGGMNLSNFGFFTEGTFEDGDREITIGPQAFAGVSVTRKVFVSPDEAFARYLEIVTNEGTQAVNVPIDISTNLGSDTETVLVSTSSGDSTFDASDHWLVTDDQDRSGDPTTLHVISGPGGLQPLAATSVQDQIDIGYQLQVGPGETQIIMHFASQNNDREAALLRAEQLLHLPPAATSGMTPTEMNQVVNFQVGDTIDVFALELQSGQEVEIFTETPEAGPGTRANTLDPVIAVFDQDGNLVVDDDNSDQDGRNALVSFTSPSDGTYAVRVQAAAGEGEYLLRATVTPIVARSNLTVAGFDPPVGTILNAVPNELIVNFARAVDGSSVDATDLRVDGHVVTGAELIDGDSVRFTLQPAGNPTELTVEMVPDSVADYQGIGNSGFSTQYSIDATAPRILGTSWNDARFPASRTFVPGRLDVRVQFDEALRVAELGPEDVWLQQDATGQLIPAETVSVDQETNLASIEFLFVSEGEYTLTLSSGDGAFVDVAGNHLDGELVGTPFDNAPSGDGNAGGDFVVSFRVDSDTLDISDQFAAIVPAGSMISRASTFDVISYDGDIDAFSFLAAPGDQIAISLETFSTELEPGMLSVEVRDPWARLVGHQTAMPDVQLVDLSGITSTAGGRYEVRVSGDRIATSYALTITKNSVAEVVDSTLAEPLSIDHTEIDGRFAVTATSESRNPTELVWGVQPATGQIIIVDPHRGTLVDQFPAPGNLQPQHTQIGLTMAEIGSTLLYVNADDDSTVLYRLDPFTGAIKSTETIAAASYDGLAFDGGKAFYGRDGVDLQRQTRAGDPPVSGWATGAPTGALAGDDYNRTFGMFTDGQIHEFDPSDDTDQFLSTLQPPAADVEGLAFDHQFLFASTASGLLYTLDPDADPEAQLLNTIDVPNGPLFGLAAMTELVGNGRGIVQEVEANNRLSRAQNVDEFFSLAFDANIGDLGENTSMRIPHVTILGEGDGSFDFYEFEVTNAGDRGIFDIDFGADAGGTMDSHLRLYSEDGVIWSQNDDAGIDEGSVSGLDSFLEFTFFQPGRYAIEVGTCCVDAVQQGATYQLHISIENHSLVRAKEVDVVTSGSNWKYWDRPESPGVVWNSITFDDSTWSQGRAQLGYGDGDEQTTISFGPDENDKQITSYYRKSFQLRDTDSISEVWIDLLRDDGAAVFLNGTRVALDGLAGGAGHDDPATVAIEGLAESEFQTFNVDASLLQEGLNAIAVEVHQHSANDDDSSFDLALRVGVQGGSLSLPTIPERDAYTIDLSGRGGHTLDIVLAAHPRTDALGRPATADFSGQQLRLLDASGANVLAEAMATIGNQPIANYDLLISDVVVPGDGVYTLELTSAASGDYSLLVTDNTVFDTEPNDSVDQITRQVAVPGSALGHVTGPGPSSVMDPRDAVSFDGETYDISQVEAHIEGQNLVVTVEFYDSFAPTDPLAATFGYIELDVDQDPLTGAPSFINQSGLAGQTGGPLGVEYAVSFNSSSPTEAFLFDQLTSDFVQSLAFTLTSTSGRVEVPLSLLDSDDGAINLGVVAGGTGINDIAPNDTYLTTRLADGTVAVSGDTYRVSLEQGQTLLAFTRTPIDDSGKPGRLDVALEMRDSAGNVVASDDGSAVDGKNAAVIFTAPSTGDYWIYVSPEDGTGTYLLNQQLVESNAPIGRFLFYNNSVLDGNNPLSDVQDDVAIAVDKEALFPNLPFSFENVSNYALGINGVMIDLPSASGTPTSADFEFRVGNDAQPESWTPASAPSAIEIRSGAGIAGSDRVTIIWPDHAIASQWLQVTVKANNTTGLTEEDVFYFGSLPGETGNARGAAEVTTVDRQGVRFHRGEQLQRQESSAFDINRDGEVDATDDRIVGRHLGQSLAAVFPTIPIPGSDYAFGDANLDGRLSTDDLLLVLQAAEFEDDVPGNSTWFEGDWDGDGDFTTSDLVLLFQQGGFEQDQAPAARAEMLVHTVGRRDRIDELAQPEFASPFRTGLPVAWLRETGIPRRRWVDDAMSTLDLGWLSEVSDESERMARELASRELRVDALDEAIESVLRGAKPRIKS